MSTKTLRDWKMGDPLSARHLQEVVDYAKRTGDLIAGPGIVITYGPSGTVISNDNGGSIIAKPIPCVVVAAPDGETEFTDERYWVQRELNSPNSGNSEHTALNLATVFDSQSVTEEQDDSGFLVKPFMASNLCEVKNHSHVLNVDNRVLVYRIETHTKNTESSDIDYSYYVFTDASIGAPQYIGMCYQGVSQNYAGWAYVQAITMT